MVLRREKHPLSGRYSSGPFSAKFRARESFPAQQQAVRLAGGAAPPEPPESSSIRSPPGSTPLRDLEAEVSYTIPLAAPWESDNSIGQGRYGPPAESIGRESHSEMCPLAPLESPANEPAQYHGQILAPNLRGGFCF